MTLNDAGYVCQEWLGAAFKLSRPEPLFPSMFSASHFQTCPKLPSPSFDKILSWWRGNSQRSSSGRICQKITKPWFSNLVIKIFSLLCWLLRYRPNVRHRTAPSIGEKLQEAMLYLRNPWESCQQRASWRKWRSPSWEVSAGCHQLDWKRGKISN